MDFGRCAVKRKKIKQCNTSCRHFFTLKYRMTVKNCKSFWLHWAKGSFYHFDSWIMWDIDIAWHTVFQNYDWYKSLKILNPKIWILREVLWNSDSVQTGQCSGPPSAVWQRAFGETHSSGIFPARNIPGEWPFGEPFPWQFTVDSGGTRWLWKASFASFPARWRRPLTKLREIIGQMRN